MKISSILIYGPEGSGKTTNAARLAAHFGLEKIKDDGSMFNIPVWNTLVVLQFSLPHLPSIHIEDALALLTHPNNTTIQEFLS